MPVELSAEELELGAKAYGFVTMPDPVTLFPRQYEIIVGCALAIRAAYRRGVEDAAQRLADMIAGKYTETPGFNDRWTLDNAIMAVLALAPPQEGTT